MQLNSFENGFGATESKPKGIDTPRSQLLFGYDLTKLSGTQVQEVFVLISCHLNSCSSCQVNGPADAAGVCDETLDSTGRLFALATFFVEKHSHHLSWAENDGLKKVFEELVKPCSPKSLKFGDSFLSLHENVSSCSSSSCFSHLASPYLTNQTLVHRSETEKFPFISHIPQSQSLSQTFQPLSQVPIPTPAIVVPKTKVSSHKENLNRKSTFKSLFHKSSKTTKKAKETSIQERKRDKLRRFFRNSFDLIRHKKNAKQIDIIAAELIKRDGRLTLEKNGTRILFDFFKSALRVYSAKKLAGVLRVATELKPKMAKKLTFVGAETAPKLLCWYSADALFEPTSVEVLYQVFHPEKFFGMKVSLSDFSDLETKRASVTSVRVFQDTVREVGTYFPLPLSFYLVSIDLQFRVKNVIEDLTYSLESKLLLNEYGFQNYDSIAKGIEPILDAFTDCDFHTFSPSVQNTEVITGFAADEYSAFFAYLESDIGALESGIGDLVPIVEVEAKNEEFLENDSLITSGIVPEAQVEITVVSAEKSKNDILPQKFGTSLRKTYGAKPFEFPDAFAEQRSAVAAILESTVGFPKISDEVLTSYFSGNVSPFMVEHASGRVSAPIPFYGFSPVGFCSHDTPGVCHVEDSVHVARCLHDSPCRPHCLNSLTTAFPSLAASYSALYKFAMFVKLAYPRLTITALEVVNFETMEDIIDQRIYEISQLQVKATLWLLVHRYFKLHLRLTMKLIESLDASMPEKALDKIARCSPGDAAIIRLLFPELQQGAIEAFISRSRWTYQIYLKKCEAREIMMHQVFIGNMALLLDPVYEIPDFFKALYIDGFDAQIEQAVRNLSYPEWVKLNRTTDCIDAASITFMLLYGVIDTHLKQDKIFRSLCRGLKAME